MKMREAAKYLLAALIALGFVALPSDAREFRSRIQIRTPAAVPANATAVTRVEPVDPTIVRAGITKIFATYGQDSAAFARMLDEGFFDRQRLADLMQERLPRDARIRVVGIQGIRTISQHVLPKTQRGEVLVSQVSVTVRTEIQFNDVSAGFQRLAGTVDYILTVRQWRRQ